MVKTSKKRERRSASLAFLDKTFQSMWERGELYLKEGKIILLDFDEKSVRAIAKGTDVYEVSMRFIGENLSRRCSCPYAESRMPQQPPCKHMVGVALLWDKSRGAITPTKEEVETRTVPPPTVTKADINALYRDPLAADLEVLRMAVETSAYVKAHARLPSTPTALITRDEPVTSKEISRITAEMERWAQKTNFDPYFCAGEMVAAFCECIRELVRRIQPTPAMVLADVLLALQKYNRKLILSLIDDSDGLHEFTEAHLDMFYQKIAEKSAGVGPESSVGQKLDEYVLGRGEY